MSKSKKLTESTKMGHNKTARVAEKPCPACHKPASFAVLLYSILKPNGRWGQKVLKGFFHIACVEGL